MNKYEQLLDFIDNSTSAYYAVDSLKKELIKNDYVELYENHKFDLTKGNKYFVTRNNSALIAFEIGSGSLVNNGMTMIASHTDSPSIKIKPKAVINDNSYNKLNIEVYGGPIISTWLDRALGMSGKVYVKGASIRKPVEMLLKIDKPIMTIPNLAIHLSRDASGKNDLNIQNEMLPIIGLVKDELEKDNVLLKLISETLNVKINDILDYELFLHEINKGYTVGFDNEFIQSGRFDDLFATYCSLDALINSGITSATKVLIAVDNEEVGSQTMQGADSGFLINMLERIYLAKGHTKEEFMIGIANSMCISADLAHGLHPNYKDKHDPTNKPVLGGGVVIKYSSNQRYSTNSKIAAVFKEICANKNIPVQSFVNRSDVRGGSTIGPVMSSLVGVVTIDVGVSILAMHSTRELAAIKDVNYMIDSFIGFYEM